MSDFEQNTNEEITESVTEAAEEVTEAVEEAPKKKKAAAQKKKDRIKAKLETQVISTGGQLLRKGLFGILFRK